MSNSRDIFRQLKGKWTIKRNIIDLGEGVGTAEFKTSETDPNCLCYREELSIIFYIGAKYDDAYQIYDFTYDPNRDVIKKYRSSKELMYELHIFQNKAFGVYECEKDTYYASYDFINERKFTITYDVKGLDKNYTIVTEFERVLDDEVKVLSEAPADSVDM